jgi:hypothetical protein
MMELEGYECKRRWILMYYLSDLEELKKITKKSDRLAGMLWSVGV